MIKVEICKCTQPYHKLFKRDELYVMHPSKNNRFMSAYISPTQGFLIKPPRMTSWRGKFEHLFFEPIATIYVKNFEEVKVLKQKSIEQILEDIGEK